jgi:iron-sulfur cluster repair protein YtfE (RIC family)
MAETPKPIKRSPELAPLSREHHEGLLFVWKLRQGISRQIEPARIAAFIEWFWKHHLEPHFQKEETVLPVVLSTAHPLVAQMFREHEAIRNRVADAVQHGNLKKFEQLAQALNDHIRFEERQLFVEVEKQAGTAQWHWLSEQVTEHKPTAVWEDAFWERRA